MVLVGGHRPIPAIYHQSWAAIANALLAVGVLVLMALEQAPFSSSNVADGQAPAPTWPWAGLTLSGFFHGALSNAGMPVKYVNGVSGGTALVIAIMAVTMETAEWSPLAWPLVTLQGSIFVLSWMGIVFGDDLTNPDEGKLFGRPCTKTKAA